MFTTSRQVFGDFKENLESTSSLKPNLTNPRKGLKSCNRNLNSYSGVSQNVKNNDIFKAQTFGTFKYVPEDKENSKSKMKEIHKTEGSSCPEKEESWPDIEKMFIDVEEDDNYEDILPLKDRITKEDVCALFMNGPHINRYLESTDDMLPIAAEDFYEEFPTLLLPQQKIECVALFDETDLGLIPLPI